MTLAIILIAVLCLAYANGANDNFKGVATLLGSGTANYRGALLWATSATFLGSLTAAVLADQLLKSFSGRGLVANSLVADPRYGAAVGLGVGLTVLMATRLGMPVSTTHGLVGALVGAGWAAGSSVNLTKLQDDFFVPLLTSPFVGVGLTAVCYPALSAIRRSSGVTQETCFCVGREVVEVVPALSHSVALQRVEQLTVSIGNTVSCRNRYQGRIVGIPASTLLDRLHYLSAGIVSFARGLNDTPKITALLLLAPHMGQHASTVAVGVTIAAGGIGSAKRVAETMSRKITPMNHGQGFAANLITGIIVIAASCLGMPASTTHVSCGALFGIGLVTRQGHVGTIMKILGAWMTTLPLGGALGAASFGLISCL
jgi:inorganic phosphate transporter, PiT family